jgi:SAM-dependent methyltransferase
MTAPALPQVPLFGSEEQFAALRNALFAAGYTEEGVCRRVGIERIFDFRLEGEVHLKEDPPDALGKLIRFLLEGVPLSRAETETLPWKELDDLGLLMPDPSDPTRSACTSALYPALGMYIASDRTRALPGQSIQPMEDMADIVYPGIVLNTGLFLSLVPFTPCDAFLDLCAGSGVAALAAARGGARHSYAYDLTARSTHFAEFNRRLNSIENATAAQGDLYDPAGEMTFDRIAVHPPYLPVFRRHAIFDSGGQDGEEIVRRIIQGLPRYLRPGGRFYALTMGTDREKPLEQRVREWLGEGESEFDVALVVRRVLNPGDYAAQAVVQYRGEIADIPAWQKFFAELGVRGLVYGMMMIQRRAERRPVFTVRRQLGPKTAIAEHQWLLEWETALVRSGASDLLALRPRAREGVGLQVTHKLEGQGWVPEAYRFDVRHPFDMELKAQAWAAYLMQRADGSLTGAELLEAMKNDGAVVPETPPHEFAHMLGLLVSGGFLQVS